MALEAERLGFGEIWLAEDYFELGGIASVAAALSATKRIPVGLGVVAACVRHPAVTAMEFATIGALFPGRFMAGIGHGAPGWVRQMGLQPTSPLGQLREATSAIRRLMAGEQLTRHGKYFQFDGIRLEHPPSLRVPIFLGVHGPRSLRLSGELADGTLLGWFSSPGYVRWARKQIEEGRKRGNRSSSHELVVLCVLSISQHDPEGIRRDFAAWAGPMLAAMANAPQLRFSSIGDELTELLAEGRVATSDQRLVDIVGSYAATGDATDCLEAVRALLTAGADRVVLVPNPAGFRSTADMVEQIRMAAPLIASVPSKPPVM